MAAALTLQQALTVCGIDQARMADFIQRTGCTVTGDLFIFDRLTGAEAICDKFNKSRPNTVAGRAQHITPLVEAKLKALIWLVHDAATQHRALTAADWNANTVHSVIERMRASESNKAASTTEPTIQPISTGVGYDAWKTQFESEISRLCSADDMTSLAYVIRKPGAVAPQGASPHEQRTYTAPHHGACYDLDRVRVYGYIQKATIQNTGAHQFVEEHESTQDGRAAWLALIGYYEGDAQTSTRVEQAQKVIAEDGCKWESDYHGNPFTVYSAKLKKAYSVLAKHGHVIPPLMQVKRLVSGMKLTNADSKLSFAVYSAEKNHPTDMNAAISEIYKQVVVSYPPRSGKAHKRKIQSAHSFRNGGRGRGGRGRGGRFGRGGGRQGRGGRGGRGRGQDPNRDNGQRNKTVNGVFIGNIWKLRNLSQDEWNKVSDYVNNERDKCNAHNTANEERSVNQVQSEREDNEHDETVQDESGNGTAKGGRNGTAFMKAGRGTY